MTRLLLDVMCGGIVAHLRMCDHDAVYADDRGAEDDERLLELASEEDRTLVTRNRRLAELADPAILLESTNTAGQLEELADAGLALDLAEEPSVCGQCNGPLRAVESGTTTAGYAPDPAQKDVWQCEDCGQFFWNGSHWDRVAETLADLRSTREH